MESLQVMIESLQEEVRRHACMQPAQHESTAVRSVVVVREVRLLQRSRGGLVRDQIHGQHALTSLGGRLSTLPCCVQGRRMRLAVMEWYTANILLVMRSSSNDGKAGEEEDAALLNKYMRVQVSSRGGIGTDRRRVHTFPVQHQTKKWAWKAED